MPIKQRTVGGNGAPHHKKKKKFSVKKKRKLHLLPTSLEGEVGEVMREIEGLKPGGQIVRMASDRRNEYGRARSGVLALDIALGGGLLLSRGSMIYGEKSTGKSTLALRFIKNLQDNYPDSVAVWIDIEGTFDPTWARKHGVDLDRVVIIEPETGEEAVDLADAAFRAKETSIVVTDSIAMLTPMKEIESSAEDNLVGVHARLTGNYLRRLNNAMLSERHRGHTPIVLHLNQFRMKIGVMFGDPRTLPGGKALEFCTSQQIQMYNKEHQTNGIVDYNEHQFKITKDKTGGKLKEGQFKLIRDKELTGLPEGYIDQVKSTITHGQRAGIIQGKTIEKYGKFKSAAELQERFLENPEIEKDIHDKIIKFYRKKWDIS